MNTVLKCGVLRSDLNYCILWVEAIGTCNIDYEAPFG